MGDGHFERGMALIPAGGGQLNSAIIFYELDAIGYAIGDNEAIRRLNPARSELFETTHETQIPAR